MWKLFPEKIEGETIVQFTRSGCIELYDKSALEFNLSRLKEQMERERKTLNIITGCLLELAIEHMEAGLTFYNSVVDSSHETETTNKG